MTNNVDILLNKAFSAYNDGDFETAESLTREALNQNSGQGDALYLLGLIAFQAKAFDAASDLLYQAVRLYPDIAIYQLTLASVLQAQGRLDEALSYYDKHQDNALSWTQKGNIFLLKKQVSFARSAFEKALTLHPDLPEAVLGLAYCDRAIGDDTSAQKRLKALNAQNPIPDSLLLSAQIYRSTGYLKEAEFTINTALSLSEQPAYFMEKGLISEFLGDLNTALQSYRRVTEMDPYRSDAWCNQGNIYQKQGKLTLAEDSYKRALQQDKTDITVHHNLAGVLYQMKRLPEALEQYRSVLSHNPNYLPSLYNLAVILEEIGNYDEAAGLYFNILAQKGNFPHLDWRIVDTLTALYNQNKSGQKEARRFAEGWVKNFPDNPIARHTSIALSGKNDLSSLNDYTRLLYNDFASDYDNHMEKINASALQEMINLLPDKGYNKILDLACGTGAFSRLFKKNFKSLTGVDNAQNMLTQAKKTKMYTHLENKDVFDFLHKDKNHYDLIIAVELVGYLPSLKDLLIAVSSHLSKNGLFSLSIEIGERTGLAPNGRFLYTLNDVEDIILKSGYSILTSRETILRRDEKSSAKGLLLTLRLKP